MKNKNVDELLKEVLKRAETPSTELVNKVKYEILKENIYMNKTVKRSFWAVAAVVAAIVLISTTAFAAWYFLKPSEVAEKFENPALSAAFDSDTAVNINKSVTSGDYTVTMLAAVSGNDITDMPYYNSDEIISDRTYAVIAIQRVDGVDMTYDESFFASPLVKGIEPLPRNVIGMNGGGHASLVIDGVLYRITECDNVEIFADRGLYFAVCSSVFFDSDAFLYNKQTGEIISNPAYNGTSAIFDLPLVKKLADPKKAEQYLKDRNSPDSDEENPNLFDGIDWEKAVPVDETIKNLTVDTDFYITYTFDFEHGSGDVTVNYYDYFSDDKTEQSEIINMMTSDDSVYATRFTKDEDGTLTGMIVMP